MSSDDRTKFFLTILMVGLALGVTLGIVGRLLDLSPAVIGGVTGALVAVVAGQLRKRQ